MLQPHSKISLSGLNVEQFLQWLKHPLRSSLTVGFGLSIAFILRGFCWYFLLQFFSNASQPFCVSAFLSVSSNFNPSVYQLPHPFPCLVTDLVGYRPLLLLLSVCSQFFPFPTRSSISGHMSVTKWENFIDLFAQYWP